MSVGGPRIQSSLGIAGLLQTDIESSYFVPVYGSALFFWMAP